MKSLRAAISEFVRKYHVRSRKTLTQSDRFSAFYRGLITSICLDLGLPGGSQAGSCIRLIDVLVDAILQADQALDVGNADVQSARDMTFSDRRLSSVAALERQCGLPGWSAKHLEPHIGRLVTYGHWEQEVEKGDNFPLSYAIRAGNCDFALYNHVLADFVLNQARGNRNVERMVRLVTGWMAGYLPMDFGWDHIVDFEADVVAGSYNALAWFGGSDWQVLCREGKMTEFLRRMEAATIDALCCQDRLRPFPQTRRLLANCLEAEMAAVKLFCDFGYFLELSPEIRQRCLTIVGKPYPWEECDSWTSTAWIRALSGK